MKRLLIAVFGVLAVDAAAQQPPATAVRAADPAAQVPPASYRSAFEGYVPYREQPLASWREVNDEVGRVGGHVGVFRGAGHGAHGQSMPAKPAAGTPATGATEAGGQAPARGAPEAPGDDATGKPSPGGHHGH
jgi:hypothetical protein